MRTDAGITLLVNNAGVGATKPLLRSDVDKMAEMISLNIMAVTRLTYAVALGFVARCAGTFINIASIVALSPESLNGVYGGNIEAADVAADLLRGNDCLVPRSIIAHRAFDGKLSRRGE